MNYEVLFKPSKIGKMLLKNRIILSPMGHDCSTPDGIKGNYEVPYYEARAKGGVGMIITGCIPITKKLGQSSREGYLDNFYVIPRLQELTDAVHRWDCRISAQLSCGTGRNDFIDDPENIFIPVSASSIPSTWNPDVLCHELSIQEIEDIMNSFAKAATIVKKAGFDAIEIHGHAGYLPDQFMSPVWNKRKDKYGGSPENNARFATDIVKTIKDTLGNDFPVTFRISLDHRFNGGRTPSDSIVLLKELEKAGVDALNVDAGCYESLDYIFPPSYLGEACMSYVCETAKKAVSIPIINGGTHNPDSATELIESGNADFVLFGRSLIADPDLPNKLIEGRAEDIKPCLRCNEGCIGNIWNCQSKTRCSVNPRVLDETRMIINKSHVPKKVAVIGSGPAGLEAAITASEAGHSVTLFEKNNKIGGIMGDICSASWKGNIKKLLAYYKTQLEKQSVKVILNKEITSDSPELANYDKIIVGCGSKPIQPNIPGIEYTVSIVDIHKNDKLIKGEKIVICGGGESGCEGALELAKDKGYTNITIIEKEDDYARDAMFINKITLSRLLNDYGIKIKCGAFINRINEDSVSIEYKNGYKTVIEADTIITAFGMEPDLDIANSIYEKYHLKTRLIGDSFSLGKIGNAIRTGYYAGISL